MAVGADFWPLGHKRPLNCLATFKFLRKNDNTRPKFMPVGQPASLQDPRGWGREGMISDPRVLGGLTGVGVMGVERHFPIDPFTHHTVGNIPRLYLLPSA